MRIGHRKSSVVVRENPLFLLKDSTIGDWWSASDVSTMFTDTGGTTGVSAAANLIKNWKGKRGVGNNPTEATNAPAYQPDMGGCARFDGTNDVLTLNGFDCYNTGGCTVIAVLKGNPATSCHVCGWGSSSSANPIYTLGQSGSSVASSMAAFLRNDANATILALTNVNLLAYDNTPRVVAAVDNAGRVSGYRNGVALEQGGSYSRAGAGAVTPDRFAIGALVRTTVGGFFAMDLYDLFVAGRALSQREIIDASRFLGRHRGIYF